MRGSPRVNSDRPGSPKAIRPKSPDRPYLTAVRATSSTLINIILIKVEQSHGSPLAQPPPLLLEFYGGGGQENMGPWKFQLGFDPV